MTQKERLVYFINRINSDEELKEEIYNKCDPDTIYPQKELMEDLEWLMEGGSEENYDLVPFANDGSGGLYLLVNDQHIAYFDSEGCAGYVAESVDDFFNILFVFRFFCLSKGVMKSYEQFLKECEEDLFEIKPSEAFERFLIKEKMETDKEKVYEKFIKGLTITPIFEINHMGLYILDSHGDLYVEGSMIIKETRGHREVYKRFSSEAEAEAYMRSLIDKGKPKHTPEEYRQMNGKHKKSHRLKNSK